MDRIVTSRDGGEVASMSSKKKSIRSVSSSKSEDEIIDIDWNKVAESEGRWGYKNDELKQIGEQLGIQLKGKKDEMWDQLLAFRDEKGL